jgi:hypothetical protein
MTRKTLIKKMLETFVLQGLAETFGYKSAPLFRPNVRAPGSTESRIANPAM